MGQLKYLDFLLDSWQQLSGLSPRAYQLPGVVTYPDEIRARHALLVGGTGAGKSRLILARGTLDAIRLARGWSNRGFAMLSSHPDLFTEMRDRLSLLALKYPRLRDRVYIMDPINEKWSAKWNPLEVRRLRPGETVSARADELARMIAVLFGDDITQNVRQQRVMTNTFLALCLARRPLPDALDFLTGDDDYRKAIVSKLGHPRLSRYWLREFRQRRDKMELIESTMNRIERFIESHSGVRFILEGPSTIDYAEIINNGGILLVNGDKGKLKAASALFLGANMHALQDEAMARLDLPEDELRPFTIYADEFQTFVTPTVREIVTESRKVKVDVLLATQTLKSLSQQQELLEVVLEVAGNLLVMRQGRADAEELVKEIFTPDLVQAKAYVDGKTALMSLPEVWESEIRKLTELPDRMVWWKRRGRPGAQLLETLTVRDLKDLPDYERLDEARLALEIAVFRRIGRPKFKRLRAPVDTPERGSRATRTQDETPDIWG